MQCELIFSDNRKYLLMSKLAGYLIKDIDKNEVTSLLKSRFESNVQSLLFFANTNFVVKCQHLIPQLNQNSVCILNDGIGMEMANLFVNGRKFTENLNGTDFIPHFLTSIPTKRIVLIGSRYRDLRPTAKIISEQYHQQVVGLFDGFEDVKDPALIEKINKLNPEIVLVGMGNPLQEEWIIKHHTQINARLLVGVGALFVFMSGNKRRAPKLMRQLKLEWLYRLFNEPKRLYKRYTVEFIQFLYLCVKLRAKQ
jgi:beta-1,4-glucosyltransferase